MSLMKGTLDGRVRGLRPRTFSIEKAKSGEVGLASDSDSVEVAAAGVESFAMVLERCDSSDGPEWLGLVEFVLLPH